MRRLDSLDGLRALAVLLVFASHIDQRRIVGGFTGVEVFFALSGYLITYLLLRERQLNGDVNLRMFYARRALRLWPALILLLIVVTPIAFVDHIGRPPLDSLAAVTYVSDLWSNYSGNLSLTLHTWSLSVEEQFYLVWPAVLMWAIARRYRPSLILTASIVVSVILCAGAYQVHRFSNPQFLPFDHVPALGGGALLAITTKDGVGERLRRAVRFGVVPVVGLIVITVLVPERWWTIPLVGAAAWMVVAHLIVHRDSFISRVFRSDPAVWLGRRSYGFYLWHYPIIILLARSFGPLNKVLIGLPLTLVATVASWQLVELPFLRLKERFEPDRMRAMITDAQPAADATSLGAS
jgi:peptidoglycan/LPS O-acetylase OafA/YrhL